MKRLLRSSVLAFSAIASGAAQEWGWYAGDAAATHYSPLAQIDRDNVKRLRVAWEWKTGEQPMPDKGVRPGMFEATFLRSDGFATHDSKAVAFQIWMSGAGEDTILKAAANDADALNAMGQFFLRNLDEPDVESARPYLEAAAALGHIQALIDLAVIAMMPARQS